MADKDDELIARLLTGGDITPQDLDGNYENIKALTESKNPNITSMYYELCTEDTKEKKK